MVSRNPAQAGPTESDLVKLGQDLLSKGPHKTEKTAKRVRVRFNGVYVVDTTEATYVWEHPYYPQFYFHTSDIKPDSITRGHAIGDDGGAYLATLTISDRTTDRVLVFEKGPLAGLTRLEFGAMDALYEEDTPIYVHPKDPFKRIDILPSTRHVKVSIDGTVIAESSAGGNMFLFETGLPARYYLPQTAVRDWKLLGGSKTVSRCPYKGEANYYDVTIDGREYRDMIWWYRYPTKESIEIAGLLCFYNEKVDIWIDGVKQERPKTHFT